MNVVMIAEALAALVGAMLPVSSSNLASVGYDVVTQTLAVRFVSGDLYYHADVPVSIYVGLMAASSKGSFYHSYIRDQFVTTRG